MIRYPLITVVLLDTLWCICHYLAILYLATQLLAAGVFSKIMLFFNQ